MGSVLLGIPQHGSACYYSKKLWGYNAYVIFDVIADSSIRLFKYAFKRRMLKVDDTESLAIFYYFTYM